MPFDEPFKTLLVYALLLAVLTIPLDLAYAKPKKAVKGLGYGLLLLLLGSLLMYALFLHSLGQPIYFVDSLAVGAAEKTCPSLFQASAAQRALSPVVALGESCAETLAFAPQYAYSFRAEKSGSPSEPFLKGVYQKTQPPALYSLAGAYDFSLYDAASNRLLGAFHQDQNAFLGPDANQVALEAGRSYRLEGTLKERPSSFKACKAPDGLPEWQLNCRVRCGADSDCGDGSDTSVDSCQFPGACQSYCKHQFGLAFTTTPADAPERIRVACSTS